jgi:hypothetical protein
MKLIRCLVLALVSACAWAQNYQNVPQFSGNLTASNSSCISASCLLIPISADTSTLTLQFTGTWSATVQFEVSADAKNINDPSANWQAAFGQPIPNGAGVTSSTANGVWQFDVAGFTVFRARVSSFSSGTVAALATLANGITGITPQPVDPCASPAVDKSSFSVAISSATTVAVQAGSSGKRVYVCAFTVTYTSGTSPTIQFEVGTGGTCGTGTTVKTGVMAIPATAGQGLVAGAGHTLFSGSAAQDMCIVSSGTTPTYNGWVTFVQM